jgi:hypothetical protein
MVSICFTDFFWRRTRLKIHKAVFVQGSNIHHVGRTRTIRWHACTLKDLNYLLRCLRTSSAQSRRGSPIWKSCFCYTCAAALDVKLPPRKLINTVLFTVMTLRSLADTCQTEYKHSRLRSAGMWRHVNMCQNFGESQCIFRAASYIPKEVVKRSIETFVPI